MPSMTLTAALVFIAVALATISLAIAIELFRNWLRQRQVAKRLRPVMEGKSVEGSLDILRTQATEARGFDTVPGVQGVLELLEQSRVGWSFSAFLVLTLGFALGFGVTILLITQSILFSGLAAFAGSVIPYAMARRKRTLRFRGFEEEFPEAIDLLTRAIRAGHPLSSGMQMVAEEGPPVVSEEFQQAFDEQRFGLPFEEAILGLVDRLDLVDVRVFAIAVLVQREVGGNLAEILDNLADVIRKRFYLRRQLRVYTAQGRMTGYALGVLPFVVGFLMYLLTPELVMTLFTTLPGWVLVGTAVFLQFVGVIWIRNIINVDL